MAKYNCFRGDEDDVQKSPNNQSQSYHREQTSVHSEDKIRKKRHYETPYVGHFMGNIGNTFQLHRYQIIHPQNTIQR